jgi:hypothetical protein
MDISVVLEPRETFFLWVFGRLRGRRDWLVAAATLGGSVRSAFEVYHPGRRGVSQAAFVIRNKGWRQDPLAGRAPLLCAAPDADGHALVREVMSLLLQIEVWRVGLHQEAPHLTISMPVPATETRSTLPVFGLLPQLAKTVLTRDSKR